MKANPISVFYDGYIERNPIRWVRRARLHVKWAWQRAVRGYCDPDVWSINSWFLATVPAMLEQLADTAHGNPAALGDDEADGEERYREWQAILRDMAAKFSDADEETCSMKNRYHDEWSRAYEEFEQEYGLLGEKLEEGREREDGFRVMHFPSEFPQWKEIMDKFQEEERAIDAFRKKRLDEAMELFRTWFWDLWD